MEITADELRERYRSMSTAELRELSRGELTPEASTALFEVLTTRPEAPETPGTPPVAERLVFPAWPRLWPGYAAAGVLLILEVGAAWSGLVGFDLAFFLLGLGVFLYWLSAVRQLHQILAAATRGTHPISPSHVVFYHFIPIFNLVWIFRWPREVARFVNARSAQPVMPLYFPGLAFFAALLARLVFDGAVGTALLFATQGYLNSKVRSVLAVYESIEELGP